MEQQTAIYLKQALTVAAGWLVAALVPVLPYALVCTAMVVADWMSAMALSRRLRRKYPRSRRLGRMQSARIGRMVGTLARVYGALVLAQLAGVVIAGDEVCVKFVAGAICFWQAWSILENEATACESRWARLAQRFLIDKAERHLGVDLDELHRKE